MTDQDAILLGCELKNPRIGHTFEIAVGGGSEIDSWFPKAHALKKP